MIVYFIKKAAKSVASVLILQPQKGRIKVLKLGAKQDQWDFVKTHVVNNLNDIHLFVTNQKGEINHQVFNIKYDSIYVPQY